MADEPIFPQIREDSYLSDFVEGERVAREQRLFSGYRRSLNDGEPMPGIEAEGSWLSSKHNPKN